MKACFLFGHADAPDTIMPRLEQAVEKCYGEGVANFYVGNRGRFDILAASAVKRAKHRHAEIKLYLVLSYHPGERPVELQDGFDGAYYPPLSNVPRRYAVVRGNRYMIDTSDYLICYVCQIGNTRKLLEYAQRRHKKGIPIENVAQDSPLSKL